MLRNTFLLIVLTTLLSCNTSHYKVLVGTETSGRSSGIYSLDLNAETGELSNQLLLCEVENPKFLCTSKDGDLVYAVSNTEKGDVISYQWNKDRSQLVKKAQHASLGKGPCHISLDNTEGYLSVSNYSGASLFFSSTDFASTREIKHKGGFENSTRQSSAHVHSSFWSPDNKYLMVVDLGLDAIIAYTFNNGELGEGHTALQLEQGNGSRHLAFSQTSDRAYLAAELSSQIYALDYNTVEGTFEIINSLSTLPSTYEQNNKVAEIKLSPDEKYVYISNRGHNSIACYKINNDGNITFVERTDVRGDFPRNFSITPDGKYLLVSNKKSHNIVVFSVNNDTGTLTYMSEYKGINTPMSLDILQ